MIFVLSCTKDKQVNMSACMFYNSEIKIMTYPDVILAYCLMLDCEGSLGLMSHNQ